MRGRNPGDLLNAYLRLLRRTLACIGEIDVRGERFQSAGVPHTLYVNRAGPIDLVGSNDLLRLRLRQRYAFQFDKRASARERWQLGVVEYSYTILPASSPASDKALMAFHHHPSTEPPTPHIHVYSPICSHETIMNSHIPSGYVGIEDVVEYLLRDWNLKGPLSDMECERVLADTRRRFAGLYITAHDSQPDR